LERSVNTLNGCEREVRIQLSEPELKPHYEQAYVRSQASITLPGFRKGKVPLPVIKQRFGREIETEALESIADAEFRSFVKDEKQSVVGNPALTDIQKQPDGVSFTIRFEVMPEIELANYRGLVVDRMIKTVTEDDVQGEINKILLRAASFEPAEEIADTMHLAAITMHELDRESSMPIIGAQAKEDRVFLDDDNVDMHLRNSLLHTKVGDSFSYMGETTDDSQTPPNTRVTVTDIQKVVPAELTNEFVEMITAGKFKTTEELREDIDHQLNDYFDRASKENLENQLVDQLVALHSFDVPHSLLHSVVHQLFEDFKKRNEGAPGIEKLTAHDLEPQFKPMAERIARWELIRGKIIEAEGITLIDEDIAAAATRYDVSDEQMKLVLRQNRGVEDQLLADKAVQVLVDYAIVNDVDVDQEQPVI